MLNAMKRIMNGGITTEIILSLDDFFSYNKDNDVLMERDISRWDDKYFYDLAVNNAKRLSISTSVLS